MVHITFAIARFFEILLLDIVKSILGLVALGIIAAMIALAGVRGVRRLCRKGDK